jgi:hypothetical protein|tara:strand:- start:175 stop:492 length:318 start_codon:yes stop_codon:yes gene_type:complete
MSDLKFGYTFIGNHVAIKVTSILSPLNLRIFKRMFPELVVRVTPNNINNHVIEGCLKQSEHYSFTQILDSLRRSSKLQLAKVKVYHKPYVLAVAAEPDPDDYLLF